MAKYKQWLEDDNLKKIRLWVRDGLSNEQVAHNMGIAESTLYEWQNKYKEFSEALKQTKEIVDYEVENKLIENAKNGDTKAIIYWLDKRRSHIYRDKKEIDINVKVDPFEKYTDEELEELLANAEEYDG